MSGFKKTSATLPPPKLRVGEVLLHPLVIKSFSVPQGHKNRADARISVSLPGDSHQYSFVIECKTSSSPQTIHSAIAQAKAAAREGEWPMILVPFLSDVRLRELERQGVSGIDLCGNGLVVVPGRLWIQRSGAANKYRDSRPLNNPYRGRSAMVARLLLRSRRWGTLSELAAAVRSAGAELSLSQASKAVQALEDDLIVSKRDGIIELREPLRLLDKLRAEWRKPSIGARRAFRLKAGSDLGSQLSGGHGFQWAVMGESSVSRYAVFSQGAPRKVAVSDINLASAAIGGPAEAVPSFADVELIETDEPGFYFDNEVDYAGIRWASRLQTWLELQAGDARQQEAARDVYAMLAEG